MAFFVQFIGSVIAVAALVGLAGWLGSPREAGPLDETRARTLLAEEFPDAPIGPIWIAADGLSALARAGDRGLILYRAGDGHVIRSAPWSSVAAAPVSAGRAAVRLDDVSVPRVRFTVGDAPWPPAELAA
jgi:hypothetical protein